MAHSLYPKVKLRVPPLRFAPVGMTKLRVGGPPWQWRRWMDRGTTRRGSVGCPIEAVFWLEWRYHSCCAESSIHLHCCQGRTACPPRYAPVGMTKGRWRASAREPSDRVDRKKQQVPPGGLIRPISPKRVKQAG